MFNANCEVENEAHEVIPGLYAGGSDAGCLYGDSYDVSLAPGSQASWANNSARDACHVRTYSSANTSPTAARGLWAPSTRTARTLSS